MANIENLKKGEATRFKSGEEAVKNGRKGGIASGEAKRTKKSFREHMEILLERLEKTGEADGDEVVTRKELLVEKAIRRAMAEDVSTKDLIKALEFIRDTVGEKPVEKVITSEVDPEVIAEVKARVHGKLDEE